MRQGIAIRAIWLLNAMPIVGKLSCGFYEVGLFSLESSVGAMGLSAVWA